MATFVLVHGGGHGGWCWRYVSSILRKAGHEAYAPTLTGLGERAHLVTADTGLETHILDIVNTLEYEDLNDVILGGHSYGGMVITGAADRALSRIRHLVYLDAAIPRDGESLVDVAPVVLPYAGEIRLVQGVRLILWPNSESARRLGVTAADDAAWVRRKLTPHPLLSFEQKLRLNNETELDRIPRTNINCTATLLRMKVEEVQDRPERLGRALAADRVWEIDTGHDLMITEPDRLAEMLMRVASI